MKLTLPDRLLETLVRRFSNQFQNWIAGDGIWPLSLSLGAPNQRDVFDNPAGVRNWVEQWRKWAHPGEVKWEIRDWSRIGAQTIPVSLIFASPSDVAAAISESRRWATAVKRYTELLQRWPQSLPAVRNRLNVIVDYTEDDFDRLVRLLGWFEANRSSGIYLRQIPLEGIDTKWIEQRIGVVATILKSIVSCAEDDFHDLCGLRRPPIRLRLQVLCPRLRAKTGGLRDIEAPIEELAQLQLEPSTVLLVENRDSGLALPDRPGAIAFIRLGNAVSVIKQLTWLQACRLCIYWGDIDTHGFFILNQARRIVPAIRSLMMDETTLLNHKHLWAREAEQSSDVVMEHLTASEADVYRGLREHRWSYMARLEQERIPWPYVLAALDDLLQQTFVGASTNVIAS